MPEMLSDGQAVSSCEPYRAEYNRFSMLLEVSESIASHRDLGELFHDLAERLPPIVPFDYINLVLHDPARRRHATASAGDAGTQHDQPGLELPVDGSPGGYVWKTQQTLVVEDVIAGEPFPRR